MSPKRFIAGLASVTLALALAACGGSGNSGVTKVNAQPSASAAMSAEPTPSQVVANVPSGIVLGKCLATTNGMQQLDFVNPADGSVNETKFFVVRHTKYHTYGICGNAAAPGYQLRSAYDTTFSNIAVHAVLPNDGYHVGIVPENKSFQSQTTEFKDLSGVTEDGFAAAQQQSPGAFGPDGKVYFVQGTGSKARLMKVDPNGGQPEQATPGDDYRNVDVTGKEFPFDWGLYFLPGNNMPMVDLGAPVAFAPDGTWMFERERTVGHLYSGIPGKTTMIEVNVGQAVPAPFKYVSKTSYYGISDDGELVLATVSGNKVTSKSLLPPTDGKILEPTVSPDGKTIAFILKKNTGNMLYTVPATGGDPTKVMAMDGDAKILDWTK